METRDPELVRSILERVNALTDKVIYYSKRQVVSTGGVTLHPGEAHMLLAAVRGMNFTAIARHFGITKGAVSQTMSRLEKKGAITINKDRAARNAATVRPTALGRRLIGRIDVIRSRLTPAVAGTLGDFDPAGLQSVELFLTRLETVFSRELDQPRSS